MIFDIGYFWLGANLFLGLFNMIPWGPLDGLKVKDWNEQVFYLVIAIFAIPIVGWLLMGYLGTYSAIAKHCKLLLNQIRIDHRVLI